MPGGAWRSAVKLLICSGYAALLGAAATASELADIGARPVLSSAAPAVQPPTLSGKYLAGQFAKSSGDAGRAADFLRPVYDHDPSDARLARQLIVLYLYSGKVEEAVAFARRLRENGQAERAAELLLVSQEIRAGEFDAARKHLAGDMSASGFGRLWLPLVQAWLQFGTGKPAHPFTVESVMKAAARDLDGKIPGFVYYHLALLNHVAGFEKQARQHYDKAVSEAQAGLKDPPEQELENPEDGQETFLPPGGAAPVETAALESGEEASRSLEEAVRQAAPGGTREEQVRHAVADLYFTLASILFAGGANDDGMLYLRMALYLRPDFPPAQLMLGSVYEAQDDYAAAYDTYGSVQSGGPFGLKARVRQVFALDRQGKQEQALKLADALAAEQPAGHEAHIARGDLLRMHGRYQDAAGAYSQAIDAVGEPQNYHWALFYARGACLERAGQWDKAEKDLLKALSLEPGQPEVLNYLGYSWLLKEQRVDEARAMLEKAVAARPGDAHIIDSLGWALYKLGDYGNALRYLEQAIELSPSDPTVNDHLGDALWMSGRKHEARYQWERVLVYSPEPELVREIEVKLKDGLPLAGFYKTSANSRHQPEIVEE